MNDELEKEKDVEEVESEAAESEKDEISEDMVTGDEDADAEAENIEAEVDTNEEEASQIEEAVYNAETSPNWNGDFGDIKLEGELGEEFEEEADSTPDEDAEEITAQGEAFIAFAEGLDVDDEIIATGADEDEAKEAIGATKDNEWESTRLDETPLTDALLEEKEFISRPEDGDNTDIAIESIEDEKGNEDYEASNYDEYGDEEAVEDSESGAYCGTEGEASGENAWVNFLR